MAGACLPAPNPRDCTHTAFRLDCPFCAFSSQMENERFEADRVAALANERHAR